MPEIKPEKQPELNLYCDSEPRYCNGVPQAKRILGMFGEYCKKIKVAPKLTIVHNRGQRGYGNPNYLWNLVDNAYSNHIDIALELHSVNFREILPIAHLISQINIKHRHYDSIILLPDAFYEYHYNKYEEDYSFDVMAKRMNGLREVNPKIVFEFESIINKENYSHIIDFDCKDPFIDKWKIYRSTNDLKTLTDFEFYSFIRNNYTEKRFVPKSNIVIKDDEKMFIGICVRQESGEFIFEISKHSGGKYSRPLNKVSFEDALQDIEFKTSEIDKQDEKKVTKNVVAKMEKFFHLK